MKSINIEWRKDSNGYSLMPSKTYKNVKYPTFIWLNKQVSRGVYPQFTPAHSCRETFANALLEGNAPIRGEVLSRARLRIVALFSAITKAEVATFSKEAEAWMKTAVKILNVLEKSQGWGLTKLRKVDDKYLRTNHFVAHAFFGSAKWMRSAPLMSIYLLCIRLGKDPSMWKDFKSLDDLQKVMATMTTSKKNNIRTVDVNFFQASYKSWPLILNNHRLLFFAKSQVENYAENDGFKGVYALINGRVSKELQDRWKKVLDKHNKEGGQKLENR